MKKNEIIINGSMHNLFVDKMNQAKVAITKQLADRLTKFRENSNEGYRTNSELVRTAVRDFLKKHEQDGEGNTTQSHLFTKNNVENKKDERKRNYEKTDE